MNVGKSTHDVISISSSDNDSDCRIMKVLPSPAKRGKNKMRWQYKLSSMPRARASRGDGEIMPIRQLNEAVYEDRRDIASTSRGFTKRLNTDLMATSGDAAHSEGSNSALTNSHAIPHVDLTDSFSIQQHTVHATDLEQTTTTSPSPPQIVESKQAPLDVEDGQCGIRPRSCSTATLDMSPARAALAGSAPLWASQQGSSKGFEGDVQGITDTFGEPSGSSSNATTELIDPEKCTPSSPNSVVRHNSDGSLPSRELLLSNQAMSIEKFHDGAKSPGKAQSSSPIRQNHRSPSLQPHKVASARARRQLPRAMNWRAWDSVINLAAFEALPGPLFTRPKEVLHSVTYEGILRERAKKEAKKRKRRSSGP
ncbi:hypothetical protein V8C37DRAFT_387957 [Trichoderma ceciliae]